MKKLLQLFLLIFAFSLLPNYSVAQTKRARHIWQKNSQKKASFLCRDGAISHSKTSRGACSRHKGIARRL